MEQAFVNLATMFLLVIAMGVGVVIGGIGSFLIARSIDKRTGIKR